jgi:peptide/nickel transport system permease protein
MLSVNVPGDPVEQILGGGGSAGDVGQSSSKLANERSYADKRTELGLDLPVFYLSLSSMAETDTLHRIPKKLHQEALTSLIQLYGNWPEIEQYYNATKVFDLKVADIVSDSLNADSKIVLRDLAYQIYLEKTSDGISRKLDKMEAEIKKAPSLAFLTPSFSDVKNSFSNMEAKATPWKNYVPAVHFYGTKNQYHRWISGFITGDFGVSYQDGRPVKDAVWEAVGNTVLISILSMIITYLIAVPIGVMSASSRGSKKDQVTTTFLFILYSLPNFWVATLLIKFFGGGDFFDWFPTYGLAAEDDPFLTKLHYLALPLFCWTYNNLAFVSRQMRGGMINALTQDYIRTAKAKGLSDGVVVWKHALRNSLLPIITLFASVFPLAISGSIVLEIIFSISGMGFLVNDAFHARNYPVIYTVVMISAIMTMAGYLIADILYVLVDPRISFSKKGK